MKINFGCGEDILKGYVNVDSEVDLNKKLPYEDDSVDEIVCFHVLEHLNDKLFTLTEFDRILKKGGLLKIKLPINACAVDHKTYYHNRWIFDRFYKNKVEDGGNKFNYDLVRFKKGCHHFVGSVLGDIRNRFFTWLDNLFYNEYYWELKKK